MELKCKAPFISAGNHIVTVFDNKYGYGTTEVMVHYDLSIYDFEPKTGY
jgi:hypothetical protein